MLASAGDHPVAQQTAIIEEKLLPIISAIREEPAKFLNRRITSSLPHSVRKSGPFLEQIRPRTRGHLNRITGDSARQRDDLACA